jgi:hypothetical protein
MAGILPERIRVRRGKTKFLDLLDFGLKEKSRDEIQEIFRRPQSVDLGILDRDALRNAWTAFLDGGSSNHLKRALWYAITLEIWLRRCEAMKDRRPGAISTWAAA